MAEFEDRYWTSADGLRLHFRDYAGPSDKPPVLCLHGLTRNARDFEGIAAHLAGRWNVLCPDLRGRGDSDYARDPNSYTPATYVGDLNALLSQHRIERFVAIGTSLGGILTMVLAAADPDRIAGAVLNDVGPEVDRRGLDRIRGYVGQGRSFETWMHAARALEEAHGRVFPDFLVEQWLTMAKRTMVLASNGRIVFDYDMKIAEPILAGEVVAEADAWPAWQALAGRPVLVIRGATSDILTAETAERMVASLPGTELLTLPRVGHPPTLDEPEAVAAIDRLLARVT
ncbi:MAG: alpha/beta hydrolase [Novosphingobium sp.]